MKPYERFFLAAIVAAAVPFATFGATEIETDPCCVFLRPEVSSFWRTATNNVVTLPVRFPEGATSATLTVTGASYSCTYENVPAGDFNLALPEPLTLEQENVFDLALSFDNGTVRTAKLGLVTGRISADEGSTRCIASKTSARWGRMRTRAVMPIPYGVTAFSVSVNGTEVSSDTGLDGARGWYVLDNVSLGDAVSLSLEADGVLSEADLSGRGDPNFMMLIR